jgi:GTP cyclohydrolase I
MYRAVDVTDSAALMRQILLNEGVEDDEVLRRTPERWVDALREMLGEGHKEWDFTLFKSDATNMVIVGPVRFASLCAHHLLPFFGTAHVGYIPQGKVVGLSKLARAVEFTAFGLWSQEELTDQILNTLDGRLSPRGAAVVMKAEHTCMSARGARAHDALTTTSSMSGAFLEPTNLARSEFLGLIKA